MVKRNILALTEPFPPDSGSKSKKKKEKVSGVL